MGSKLDIDALEHISAQTAERAISELASPRALSDADLLRRYGQREQETMSVEAFETWLNGRIATRARD